MVGLVVELKGYGFRFFLDSSPNESYFIKDNGDSFVLVIESDREAKGFVDEKYENLGAKDLKQLLCELVKDPSGTLNLLGINAEIDRVVIEYT